ncbi:MAG TPA: hypothetical protein VFT15_08830 [Chitinophagaceae bacterium]|nr:hypothetical protein [Chitinophagaceae bacterium]
MHFNKIPFLLVLLAATNCFSQNDARTDIRDITKLNFFDPGISYEKRIGKLQSLTAQAFLSTAIYIGYSDALGNTSGIDVYPALSLQYRYYYNAAKRNAKGKRTEMNSLNYVTGIAEVDFYREQLSFTEDDLRTLKVVGIAWGLQRNYPKRFSLDLSVGLGYVFSKQTTINDAGELLTETTGAVTNIGQIGLGFWLNKRD